jgi:hypothetical protein
MRQISKKKRKKILKSKLRNQTALFAVILLTVSTFIAPGILAFRPSSISTLGTDQHPRVSSSAGLTPGKANLIGTVEVSSLPSPQANFQSTPTLNTFAPKNANSGTAAPAVATSPSGQGGGGGSSSVSVINGFDGLNMLQSGFYYPPDVQAAAGPNHVVEMVNLAGDVFTKQDVLIKSFSLSSFFNSGSFYLSDPKVLYDSPSGRWFSSIIVSANGFYSGNVTIAVSATNDPTGTWQLYNLVLNDFTPDQPLLGISNDKVVVSANDYAALYDANGHGVFVYEGAQYWILNKSEMVAGASTIDFDSVGPNPTLESVYPVQSLSSTTTQYMVTVGAPDIGQSSSSVKLLSITGTPTGTVTITSTSLTIATITSPPNGVQPGTNNTVTTNDYRVLSAAWYQGNLWYSLTDSCVPTGDNQTRSCARLTEINTSTPTIVQDINYGANGQYYFFPAVSIDGNGGLDAVYGYSSSTIYPSLAVTGQAPGATKGTLALAQVLKQGTANESSTRYGDFFGAGVDPSDPTIVWVAGEYHNIAAGSCGYAFNCWSTFIGSITGVASFALSPSSSYLDIASGSSGTDTVSVTALASFSGTVTLTSSVSINGPTASLSANSVTVPPTSSPTLTVTVPNNITSPFSIYVTATSGSISHQTTISVMPNGVPDFSISAGNIITGTPGLVITTPYRATTPIVLGSISGFSGTISLSYTVNPSGPILSLAPASVTLVPTGTGFSTLYVTAPSNIPPGVYGIKVTGTSGSVSHTTSIALVVTPVTFPVNTATSFNGVNVTASGSVQVDSPSTGLWITVSGTVAIVATNATTGAVLFSASDTGIRQQFFAYGVGGSGGYTSPLIFNVTAGQLPLGIDVGLNISSFTATTPGLPSESISVSRNPDVHEYGTVNLSDVLYVHSKNGCTIGMLCYDPRADLNADGIINATDYNIVLGSRGALNYNQFQFNITASPSSLAIVQGTVTTLTVSVSNLLAFAGTATLTATAPAGLTAALNPSTVTVSGPSTLTIYASSSITPGQYAVVVSGNSGFASRSATITVTVSAPTSDFKIIVNPAPVNVPVGGLSAPTVIIASVGGFSGKVNLVASTSFSGLSASLNPTSVSLASGGTSSSILTLSSSTLGIYSVTVTATSGILSHSITVLVYVASFVFNSNFTSTAFKAGSPGAAITFYMFSVNGALNITLSAKPSKPGLTISWSTNPVSMPAAHYASTIMGITSNTVGTYTVSVTATSGPVSKSITISVNVCLTWTNCCPLSSQASPASCPTLPTPAETQLEINSPTRATSMIANTATIVERSRTRDNRQIS